MAYCMWLISSLRVAMNLYFNNKLASTIIIIIVFKSCLSSVAIIPVAVTSNQPACPGESVAVQCTVGGDVLTWNIPEGALNLLRGRHEGDVGSFHWTLLEIDENTLQSTLTFAATTEFDIGCSNHSVQLQVEGGDQLLLSVL